MHRESHSPPRNQSRYNNDRRDPPDFVEKRDGGYGRERRRFDDARPARRDDVMSKRRDDRREYGEQDRERERARDRERYNSGRDGDQDRDRVSNRDRDRGHSSRAGPSSRRSASPRPRSSRPHSERPRSVSPSQSPSPVDKTKPNFAPSGLLAAETNTVKAMDGNNTVLKYNEPPEARKPVLGWRLYVFKGSEQVGA